MKVRGERECRDCGTQWSYYETGGIECPDCGSPRSVGVGDRHQHTDTGGDLDLDDARRAAGDQPLRRAASVAEDACRDYLTGRGFIAGGDLRPLDDPFVAAMELKHAASTVTTMLDPDEAVEQYVLSLVQDADDGERPVAAAVPRSMRSARGLGVAAAVRAYRLDLRTFVDDPDTETPADALRFVDRLADHEKRVRALDGDVDPSEAEVLLAAARAVGNYVRVGTGDAAETATARLDALG